MATRNESPIWLAPAVLLVVVVLAVFGLAAAMTGEWDVAFLDLALVGLAAWWASDKLRS